MCAVTMKDARDTYETTMTDTVPLQESAIDFQEIEEALMIVKQRKETESHDLDFLHKVDDERSKGLSACLLD